VKEVVYFQWVCAFFMPSASRQVSHFWAVRSLNVTIYFGRAALLRRRTDARQRVPTNFDFAQSRFGRAALCAAERTRGSASLPIRRRAAARPYRGNYF
jgi:hypothetical protein